MSPEKNKDGSPEAGSPTPAASEETEEQKIARGIIPAGTEVLFGEKDGLFAMFLTYPSGKKVTVTDPSYFDGSHSNGEPSLPVTPELPQ